MKKQENYFDDGYMIVRNLLLPGELKLFQKIVEYAVDRHAQTLLSEGKIDDIAETAPFERRMADLYRNLDNRMRSWNTGIFSRELYNLITHKNILDVVESLIGSEIIHHGDFHLRPKLPGRHWTAFPWHQDSQYYGKPTQHMHVVTVSLPLVEVTEANGCIWVIPGSHHWGYLDGERGEDHNIRTFEDVEKRGDPIPVPLSVGDGLFLTNLTFHSSKINQTQCVRWTIDLRYSAIPGTKHLNPVEQDATDYMFEILRRNFTPLIVRSNLGRQSWQEWEKANQIRINSRDKEQQES